MSDSCMQEVKMMMCQDRLHTWLTNNGCSLTWSVHLSKAPSRGRSTKYNIKFSNMKNVFYMTMYITGRISLNAKKHWPVWVHLVVLS